MKILGIRVYKFAPECWWSVIFISYQVVNQGPSEPGADEMPICHRA